MKRFRVVIDTNVVISSLRSKQGTSYALMKHILHGSLEFVLSVPLVIEYEKIAIANKDSIPFSTEEVRDYLDYLCHIAIRQRIHYLWRPVLRDPKDDMILELAVAGHCKFIITFNKKDFGGSEKFGIIAIRPRECLEIQK